MATRTDITIEYNSNPRIAEVAAPSTEFVMQDVVDTLRKHEDSFQGMSRKKLLNASGKEDLGGGSSVGITVALQDSKIAFEARTTPAETGTVTGSPASPVAGRQIMQDTAALFQTALVQRGSLVINFSDNSIADVVSVDSETQLTTKTLVNGISNIYTATDVYHVYNVEQVSATGGNLTAVNASQVTIPPILPTAFTQVVLTSSSSGTISNIDSISDNLQRFIESSRSSHHAYGNTYYWDPVNGNDANTGKSILQACKTFSVTESKVTAFAGDVIFALNGNPSGVTTVTTPIKMTKERTYLRGPGRVFNIIVNDASNPAIWVSAEGCGVEGVAVQQNNAAQNGVKVDKHNALLRNIIVSGCAGDGVEITNIVTSPTIRAVTILENVESISNAGHGLYIHDTVGLTFIKDGCHFEESGGDGIRAETNVDDVHIIDTILHENTGYGINLLNSTVANTSIINPRYINNVAGNLNNLGTNTVVIGDDTKMVEMWKRLGLDPDAPMTSNADGSITVGGITINATPSGSSITQTRA